MSADNSLYFLADFEKYKNAKINILSSKSNVLQSREKIKSIIELKESEDKLKSRIIRNMNSVRLHLKKLTNELPKPKDNNKNEKDDHKKSRGKKDIKQVKTSDNIKTELDEINKKLAELGSL